MMKSGFHHGNNFGRWNTEGTRKHQNRFQRGLSQGSFQHRDVSAIQPSIECDSLLSFTRAGTEFPKNPTKCLFDRFPRAHGGGA